MIAAAVVGYPGRADRAAAHRHLFRHDHRGDRGSISFSSSSIRCQTLPAARTACPACRRRVSTLALRRIHFIRLVALSVPGGLLFHRHRDRVADRAFAGRRHPQRDPRQSAARAAVGHNIHGYKLTAFVIAAAYAGFAGGLLGVMQGFMPPDAFTFDTSGQLVMQTAIGGAGTLFGPLLGAAVWLYLQRFPADRRCSSARPGSWCSASCSCCWCASCGTVIVGGSTIFTNA